MRIDTLAQSDGALWGRMPVGEMVCHTRDAFAMALGERAAAPVKRELPGPVFKWLALSVPMRWPKNYATVPELQHGAGCSSSERVFFDVAGLRDHLDRFVLSAVTNGHPIFGTMSRRDWMRWGYLHLDHHLRQFGR